MSRGWRIADGALAHIPQRPTAAGEVFLVDHDVQYSPRLLVEVTVIRDARGRATDLEIRPKEARLEWALMAHGAYLPASHQLPAERSMRLRAMVYPAPATRGRLSHRKSDLWLRPVVHQKTERVEAHILVCFLALGAVANPGDVDAAKAWALAPANFSKKSHSAQHGRDPASQRPRRSPPARRR